MFSISGGQLAALVRFVVATEKETAQRGNPSYVNWKIPAIKRLSEVTGFSLLDSKNLVEATDPPPVSDPLVAYIDSMCGR